MLRHHCGRHISTAMTQRSPRLEASDTLATVAWQDGVNAKKRKSRKKAGQESGVGSALSKPRPRRPTLRYACRQQVTAHGGGGGAGSGATWFPAIPPSLPHVRQASHRGGLCIAPDPGDTLRQGPPAPRPPPTPGRMWINATACSRAGAATSCPTLAQNTPGQRGVRLGPQPPDVARPGHRMNRSSPPRPADPPTNRPATSGVG